MSGQKHRLADSPVPCKHGVRRESAASAAVAGEERARSTRHRVGGGHRLIRSNGCRRGRAVAMAVSSRTRRYGCAVGHRYRDGRGVAAVRFARWHRRASRRRAGCAHRVRIRCRAHARGAGTRLAGHDGHCGRGGAGRVSYRSSGAARRAGRADGGGHGGGRVPRGSDGRARTRGCSAVLASSSASSAVHGDACGVVSRSHSSLCCR